MLDSRSQPQIQHVKMTWLGTSLDIAQNIVTLMNDLSDGLSISLIDIYPK